jgi:N6-adenosine-specific RNA methylase IME4/ParB-like chromosome segregation protein Spo0J
MKAHIASELFPLLDDADLARLVESMRLHGYDADKPVLVFNGEILDGRNRVRAAELAGVTPVLKDVTADVEDPYLESWKQNGARRDLEPDQRVAIRLLVLEQSGQWQRQREAAKRAGNVARAEAIAGRRDADTGRVTSPPPRDGASDDKRSAAAKALAKESGVSTRTAERVIELRGKSPEKFAAVSRGEAKANAELKSLQKAAVVAQLAAEPPPLPSGPFRVICADPPWAYEKRSEDATHRGANPYPTMSTEEICALPVEALAHDDAILWLWTTNAFMPDAFRVLAAWGFQHKTILTWAKNRMGTGDWLRGQTEHCILAVRGKPTVDLTNQTTLLMADAREHSRKPEAFYALVEGLCPGSKLEMFAREARPGWEAWGAETAKFEAAQAA